MRHQHSKHEHSDPRFGGPAAFERALIERALSEGARFGRGPRGDGPPFGPGFGPPFGGRRGGGRGRVGRGQIRTALLALLEDESMHGYEMIRQIDERSGGRWKPSPGAVYPTLQQMTDEGLVTVVDEGGKKVFSLTAEGREVVADLSDADRRPWEVDGDDNPMWDLKPLMKGLAMAAASAMSGTPDQVERAKAVLNDARRSLYAILAEDPASTPSTTEATAPEGESSESA